MRLARLRALRNFPQPAWSLAGAVEAERSRVARAYRAVGGAALAWAAAAPADLVARSRVLRLARGVLTVQVSDDAARFALDRWLRSGGQADLARRTPSTLRKVHLVL
jgi:hypothetical protein